MLDTVAHSRLGLVDRHAPAVRAPNTLTQGGIGLRLLVPVLAQRLDPDPYLAQLEAAAELVGQSTVVLTVMRELAANLADASAVRQHDPVTLEVLGYDVEGVPEALAVAHPLRVSAGPAARLRVLPPGVRPPGTCDDSWLCPLGRTNSRGAVEQLRRTLRTAGYTDAATLAEDGSLADTALSTLIGLDPAGNLTVANTRCDTCVDLLALAVLEQIGLPAVPRPGPAWTASSQGGWLFDATSGITELGSVGDERVAWSAHGHDLTRQMTTALGAASYGTGEGRQS